MRYRLRDIPALLRTPIGRYQFIQGIRYRSWPLLSRIARLHRRMLGCRTRIVAVVGTYGKSTTLRCTASALHAPIHLQSTVNSWSNVAQAVLRIRPWQRHAVIEIGIDGAKQMVRYAQMVRPDIAVVTSIGLEHHRSLGTLEVTRNEKAEMVRILSKAGIAVLNGDDPNTVWMRSQTQARVITFGLEETNDVRATQISLNWPDGTRFKLYTNGECRDVSVQLMGPYLLYPVLAAIAVASAEGFTLDQIQFALRQLPPTPGRMQPIALSNGAWILRDDFKSSLETIHAALEVFAQIQARRRILLLGQVTEPPGSQGPIYWDIGNRFAKIVSKAVVVGGNIQRYAVGVRQAGLDPSSLLIAGDSVLEAAAILREEMKPEDVLLIKGRHDQRLERVALSLMGRTVRCNISRCRVKPMPCANCPMLERGWTGRQVLT
jgi:UDP-N-acetylmuramoyl-tripeptide--D-alanyl-D-alanine ligase